MNTVDFSTITKPTPADYDAANPTKQQEQFYYRLNQLFDQLTGTMNLDLAEEIGALAATGETVEIANFIKIHRHGRTLSFTLTP